MRYFIVDDDPAIREMLAEIIEDGDLGEVVDERDDGSDIDADLLQVKKVDILLIDLLMPSRDGIETVRDLGSSFNGKVVMISQVESKELVGEAYSLGIEYYITKPINQLEVLNVLQKVNERVLLEKSIYNIQKSLSIFNAPKKHENLYIDKSIVTSGKVLLSELGIIGESGSKDLLDMLVYLFQHENETKSEDAFSSLKDIFECIISKRLETKAKSEDINREIKASEQRVRRAIHQALIHIASLGLTDYTNPTFEKYASKFFDYEQVRKKMMELQDKREVGSSHIRINTRKFIQMLYLEAKQWNG
ncbi:response regulator [Bacillus taeanensis]|uniref:Transcriptional regulator n=1 Tax=Bacillus taeanensis TaxID=273032 RepID=A0A366XMD1_9BACI|nr:response regulator [Bacillus taeanensis]RBW67292.1 transcriptional regulator [Bacillus taeanensis]